MIAGWGDGTRVVHAGLPEPAPGQPFLAGPVLAAPYHLDPVDGPQPGLDGYGRIDNPTWRALEDAIGMLEGGECLVFASGMAAISAVLLTVARPGAAVVLPADGYYKTRAFATSTLDGLGVTVRLAPTLETAPPYDGAALVLLESPANPGLDVCDIGAIAGPFEAWLAHRSLGTLEIRLERQSGNASALAGLLCSHRAVTSVRWPGLPTDPAHRLAMRQMRRIPGIVTFTLADKASVDRFLRAARLVAAATSFGGLHTSADRRAQWGDDTPPGLVRLSCGIEDTADLVADVRQALDAVGSAR